MGDHQLEIVRDIVSMAEQVPLGPDDAKDVYEALDQLERLQAENANLCTRLREQARRVKALEKVANLARTIQRHKSTLPEQDCDNEEYREVIQAHTDLEVQLDEQMHEALREAGMGVG